MALLIELQFTVFKNFIIKTCHVHHFPHYLNSAVILTGYRTLIRNENVCIYYTERHARGLYTEVQ